MKKLAQVILLIFLIGISKLSMAQSTITGHALSGTLPGTPTEYLGSSNVADLLFKTSAAERMRILSTGNVGIGTGTPKAPLNVCGLNAAPTAAATANGIFFIGSTSTNLVLSSGIYVGAGGTNPYGWIQCRNQALAGYNSPIALNPLGGNVGVGVALPSQKLEVGTGNALIKGVPNFTTLADEAFLYLGDNNHFIKSKRGSGVSIGTYGVANGIFLQENTGNVAIGTALTTNPYGYKLAVNGIIGAKAIKVEISSTTWADFVFKSEYKLMPLEELESYIIANNHLPEIPSADEIEKTGLDLGELIKLQMQKIEELTLYLIELKKENLELTTRIEIVESK